MGTGAGNLSWDRQKQTHEQALRQQRPAADSGTKQKPGQQEVPDTNKKNWARSQVQASPRPELQYVTGFAFPLDVLDVSEKAGCNSECYLTWDFQVEISGRSCLETGMTGGELVEKLLIIYSNIPRRP